MARTISDALLAAQQSTQAKPHIHIVISEEDYSDRLMFLEHHEEAYRDRAVIVLRNNDRLFNDLDLRGYTFQIGYGYYTGETVEEPDGDGEGNEYSYTADLWVKSQELISAPGVLLCRLNCEGMWSYMREQKVMSVGDAPYFNYTWEATTIYDIIEAVIESAMSWTLNEVATSDSIIDSDTFDIDLNEMPYETAAELIYRLLALTKSYLRARAGNIWDVIYPQSSDTADETYYSDQQPYFLEYTERKSLCIPNRVAVYCNQDQATGEWTELITGDTGAYSGNYTEVLDAFIAGTITDADVANRRANAILAKVAMETLGGRLVIRHDARVELYDKVAVWDGRGIG